VLQRSWTFIRVSFILGFLSGCMFPQEEREQLDQLPQHVAQVQSAVTAYVEQNQVLPYKYVEDETILTTKYLVDFRQLQSYIGEIPPTAFEKGGSYLYVLIDVEKNPTVRLFDLSINGQVGKVQAAVTQYRQQQTSLPVKEEVATGIYALDFAKLGMEPVMIRSPYSVDGDLPLLLDRTGKVHLDYRVEVMKEIQSTSLKPVENEDLRAWISRNTFFVPAFSLPMMYKEQDPVFASNEPS
jgi:hypothetical protein